MSDSCCISHENYSGVPGHYPEFFDFTNKTDVVT
jgi:hypothetical protein